MPQYRNPFEKGDLYIKFDVQFPENNWINPDKLSVSCFCSSSHSNMDVPSAASRSSLLPVCCFSLSLCFVLL